jgi:CubicO group peptidase (beta-lactamase class C family)
MLRKREESSTCLQAMSLAFILVAGTVGCGNDPASSAGDALSSKGAGVATAACHENALDEILGPMAAQEIALQGVPGGAFALVKGDEVRWAGGFGMADIARQIPVRKTTPFGLASISKTMTATALMQLYERGKLLLDDDINAHLPFPIRNPNFPAIPITIRMLLDHTSGLLDNWDVLPQTSDGDLGIPLDQIIRNYFQPSGPWYDAVANFATFAPGTDWSYSNMGFTLVGYLVQVISHQDLDAYARRHIFEPLDMNAGYFLSDFDTRHKNKAPAVQYNREQYTPGYLGVAYFPAGGVRTDVLSLSQFMIAQMNGGRAEHTRILRPETVDMMHTPGTPDFPWYGLGFELDGDYVGHFGWDWGTLAYMYYRQSDKVGVIGLVNADADAGYYALIDVVIGIWDVAATMDDPVSDE